MSDCGHNHSHQGDTRKLSFAFVIISVFMIVEIVGGIISGSLALLADAGHMMTDALALGLAISAQWFALRPADQKRHFGYQRVQVLAAFANGILLIILLAWIIFEAVNRFIAPQPVAWGPMLVVAILGLIVNGAAFFILHGAQGTNINVRAAMLHVISDFFGSVVAVVAAILIATMGWFRADPILSILVAGLIARSGIRLLCETGHILLEGAPPNICQQDVITRILAVSDDIVGVEYLQIWQIKPGEPRSILQLRVREGFAAGSILEKVKSLLAMEYGIVMSTIEIGPISAVSNVPRHRTDPPTRSRTGRVWVP